MLSFVLDDIGKTTAELCGATRTRYADDTGVVKHLTPNPRSVHSLYFVYSDFFPPCAQ